MTRHCFVAENLVEIDGSAAAGDRTARYYRDGKLLAAASIGRDFENLQFEHAIEHMSAESHAKK